VEATGGDDDGQPGTLRDLVRASEPGSDDGGDGADRAVAHDPAERRSGIDGRGGTDDDDLVHQPIPEADSEETAEAWEESGAMEGQAPTG